METRIILPSQIVFPPADLGLRPEPKPEDKDWNEKFVPLLNDLRTHDLLNMFSVVERPDGTYMVTDGSRRAKAVKLLAEEGVKYVDGVAVQVVKLADIDILERQIAGNFNAKNTSSAQYLKALQKILIAKNYSIAQLASAVGMTEVYVRDLLKINYLPAVVREMVDAGDISITNAIQLNKLPEELMTDEMIKDAAMKSGTDFAAKVAETVNNHKKAQRSARDPEAAKTFVPSSRLLKKDELSVLLTQAEVAYEDTPSEYNKGALDMIKRVWSLDEASIAEQKEEFEKKLAESDRKKEERKAEREAKQLEEAKETLRKHGIQL